MAIQVQVNNTSFLIPEGDDPCAIWVGYFSKLQKELGKSNARTLWLVTWKEKGAVSCLTNPSFNNWLQKNDIDVSNAATRTVADLSEIGGNVMGISKNLTKVFSIGVPIVLAVALLSVLIILRNTTKNADLTDLSMLTPMGRGLKLLGK